MRDREPERAGAAVELSKGLENGFAIRDASPLQAAVSAARHAAPSSLRREAR
jgi:hypothetical protein